MYVHILNNMGRLGENEPTTQAHLVHEWTVWCERLDKPDHLGGYETAH